MTITQTTSYHQLKSIATQRLSTHSAFLGIIVNKTREVSFHLHQSRDLQNAANLDAHLEKKME